MKLFAERTCFITQYAVAHIGFIASMTMNESIVFYSIRFIKSIIKIVPILYRLHKL